MKLLSSLDIDRLVMELLDTISDEQDAAMSVDALAWELAWDYDFERMDPLGELIRTLGHGLLHQIQALKLYEKELLHYQFERWHQADLVVRYALWS